MKRLLGAFCLVLATSSTTMAGPCEDRFAELLVNGNADQGPVRIHITQEIVGGQTTKNYHYSDGKFNGMTEMIDPAEMPWSLFIGDKMYMSNDKGKTWSFMNSYDAEKGRADMKVALSKDGAEATDVVCGKEDADGVSFETVEGNYKSSMSGGAAIFQKYWVNTASGWIEKTFMHTKMSGFESKSTQVIEPYSDFVLPKPE